MTTTEELKAYIATILPTGQEGCYGKDNYWYVSADLPSYYFNREILPAGTNETYPDGVLGIRVDDDFWTVAALPFEFSSLSIQELVAILWPKYVDEAEYGPDSDISQKTLNK